MKWLLSFGAVLLAVPFLQALPQDDTGELSEGAAAYKALAKEYGSERNAYYRKMRELSEDPEAQKALASPMGDFLPRFLEGARKYAGSDDAIPFLVWTVENAPDGFEDDAEVGNRAIATLLSDHMGSEALESFATKLSRLSYQLGAERCRAALGTIVEQSPHLDVRLQAMFSRAQLVLRDSESTKSDRELAALDLAEIVKKSTNDGTVKQAEGCLFELENLQIGMVAPDIEAEDLEGVMFKLSDYRGKVVVLDFWGDW